MKSDYVLGGDSGSRTKTMNSDSEREIDTWGVLSGNTTYLGFEQLRTFSEGIKLSTIRLGNEHVGEGALLRPGSRYAIFKVTNGTMTARIGVWSWTAQEVH